MSEQYMENINSGDESDHDLISTEMLVGGELIKPEIFKKAEIFFAGIV